MKIPLELPSLVILTGGLGSGKTELASNFAFSFSEMGEKNISIIDLDNIKPYFKVRNLRADYKSAGIAMIAWLGIIWRTWRRYKEKAET